MAFSHRALALAASLVLAACAGPERPDSPIRNAHPSFSNWVSAAFRLMAIVDRRDDPFSPSYS